MSPLSTLSGAILEPILKGVLALLLSLLSWNAIKLCTRMDACERAVVSLQITDAGRSEKIDQIGRVLDEMRLDVKKLLLERARP